MFEIDEIDIKTLTDLDTKMRFSKDVVFNKLNPFTKKEYHVFPRIRRRKSDWEELLKPDYQMGINMNWLSDVSNDIRTTEKYGDGKMIKE